MEIQQKVKRYKDRILELENELEQGAAAITAYEQKVTYCLSLTGSTSLYISRNVCPRQFEFGRLRLAVQSLVDLD